MARFLTVLKSLPLLSCSRQDFYDEMEGLAPTVDVVDDETIEVVSNKLYAKLNVPRWVKVGDAIGFADLSDSATTNDIELFTLPAQGIVHAAKIKHSEAFAGGAVSAMTLSVGITGSLAKYLAAFDVFQAVGDAVYSADDIFGAETHDSGGTSIRLAATSTGADLDALTAGVADVWVLYSAAL
ncbi:hypothetical protein N9937_01615 [bacterium]|nr:hypothetical protein [bacterium]